ncbi:hypothetical protein [Parageobacillus thermoglucosidasius]|uniref:Uncharacterized protein n=1 Tax=Parageobacillus thermoglucosidasius TaxID=1426 RepID=A0AB38QZB3_PARTM|nr:hypothetical protein [Parageobacillus thermoglucosidasius]UOE75812.1 hypothetical protein IMI45_16105 [Parageobacillus thermoglucosidasius]
MKEEHEKMTMSQRIAAFYRQSGGPGNPQISRILEEHLLYGKDHGVPGKKEDIKDVFTEVFLNDHSTQPLVMGLLRVRMALKEQWETYLNALRINVKQKVEELEKL